MGHLSEPSMDRWLRGDVAFPIVISGPSGAGKTSLVDLFLRGDPQCTRSISATTRPRRSTEQDGVQYEFVDVPEFERRRAAGEFLEWAQVHDNLYATPARFVDEGVRAGRVVVLDAGRDPDVLHADVVRAVAECLARRGGGRA